ncbi:MAG: hypothetical protein ABIA76_03805 [Candidatus Diapherotrites archaeon]
MSLITLTFGYGSATGMTEQYPRKTGIAEQYSRKIAYSGVRTPAIDLKQKNGVLKIRKTSEFFNVPDVYVIAEVVEGIAANTMKGCINGIEFCLRDVESKNGSIAKKGTLMSGYFAGVTKEELEIGQEINVSVE